MFGEYLVQLVAAVTGTIGFCLVFNIKKNKLVYGCIGGAICTIVYFFCIEIGFSDLMANMIPAIIGTLYAEIIARVAKAPATVFLIPSVIPLIPGGSLYYTMSAVVEGNEELAKMMGTKTCMVALGISFGIVFVSVVFYKFSHKGIQLKVGNLNNQ